jgi:CRP/FNR family cyclic AMP-dependent transcriptional regulator
VRRRDVLRAIPLFEGLSESDADALAGALVERRFRAEELVFQQGDAGSSMFLIASGAVNIHLPAEGGGTVSLKDLAPPEYFGELSVFEDSRRSSGARATTETVLLELGRAELSSYLERRPVAAMAILRTLSQRLRETNALLSERAAKNARAEIEQNLAWPDRLADRVAELNGSWKFVLSLLGFVALWMVVNTAFIAHAARMGDGFDPYPYIFFNLVLTIIPAMQGPLIVMSQNRKVSTDRATAATDFRVNLKNEMNIDLALKELTRFHAECSSRLDALEASGRLTRRTG